jgi:Alpha/beta hydrolase
MTTTYGRLRLTDPARWQAAAVAWRSRAATAGRWSAELRSHAARVRACWSGAAADAALARLAALRRRLDVFRLLCWQADQALSEFAAALRRARTLLATAVASAVRSGLVIDDGGTVHGGPGAAVAETAAALSCALRVATDADSVAAVAFRSLTATAAGPAAPPVAALPSCAEGPAGVRRWWDELTPAQRRWLVAADPSWIAPLDGVPAADRDLANRLLLDDRRAEIDQALAHARGADRRRLRRIRDGLAALADRLAAEEGPRVYLLRLDIAGEGRAVVALGDPDRAANVLTHVPGMTAGLASYEGELTRAERVAVRAAELDPAAATSAVLWLDYDAPDFVGEASSARQARAGAAVLRRFQDGLRASHAEGRAHQTVLGHSYGSLVVGAAAAAPGLQADSIVFVGSPGVGVDAARDLHAGQVWSTTSRSDVIQYLPVAPKRLVADLAVAGLPPFLGGVVLARPQEDLWFGRNPSDPAFGARVFASQPGAGHLGYWDRGRPALDAITTITVGRDVTPR